MKKAHIVGLSITEHTYQPDDPELQALVAELDDVENQQQLAGAFVSFPKAFGFDYATFIVLRESKNRLMTHRILTSLPKSGRKRLCSKSYLKTSPIIQRLRQNADAFFLPGMNGEFVSEGTINNQFTSGIAAFRTDFPSGLQVAVILSSGRKTPWPIEQYEKRSLEIQFIARQFIDAFVYFASVGHSKTTVLTEEERLFLRILAVDDKPAAAASREYSFGSGSTIQTSLARKLGVQSLFQALALAVKWDQLESEVFDEHEILSSQTLLKGWEFSDD